MRRLTMIERGEILARFDKVYKSGEGEYQCLCPSHDDRSASLGLKFKEDKLIGNCFAGCSWEDVLGAAGLSWEDVMPTRIDNEWKPRNRIKFNPYGVLKAIKDDVLFIALCSKALNDGEALEEEDRQKLFKLTGKLKGIYDNIR